MTRGEFSFLSLRHAPSLRCPPSLISRAHLFGTVPSYVTPHLMRRLFFEILKRVQDDKGEFSFLFLRHAPHLFGVLSLLCHAALDAASR